MRSCSTFTVSHMKSSTDPAAWFMRSISFLTSANAEPGGIEFPGHETEARAVKLTPRRYILALWGVEKHWDESPPPTLSGRAPEWEPACSEAHRGCSTPGRRAPQASPAIPALGQSSATARGPRPRTTQLRRLPGLGPEPTRLTTFLQARPRTRR